MPDFQYIARETTGRQVNGVLSAASKQEALSLLAGRSLFPVTIDMAAESAAQRAGTGRRVRPKHLAIFYTQLGDLLNSGVPLLRSLDLLERQSHKSLQTVIQDIREQVAEGSRLADSMRRHPKVFGDLSVSMVRAGEEGGFLEDVLRRIAAFTEHQQELKARVVGAMVYPAFLLVMGTLIVAGMLTFFVPKFEGIFKRIEDRIGLPWATKALMSISVFFENYWWVLAGVLGGGIALFLSWVKTTEGRKSFDKFRLVCPGLGKVVRTLAIARFCRILGTLLRNGVPIIHSMRIAKDATGNHVLADAIAIAADQITAGKSLAQPLAVSGEFPEEVVEMITVGEEANNLENVLIEIAEGMERRTNRNLDMLVRMLEPLLLTLMAGLVLFVVIALMWPILQSSSIV